MTAEAERMSKMRKRRRRRGLRELRLVVPDARSRTVKRRIAQQVARLNREDERTMLAGSNRFPSSTPMRRSDVVAALALVVGIADLMRFIAGEEIHSDPDFPFLRRAFHNRVQHFAHLAGGVAWESATAI